MIFLTNIPFSAVKPSPCRPRPLTFLFLLILAFPAFFFLSYPLFDIYAYLAPSPPLTNYYEYRYLLRGHESGFFSYMNNMLSMSLRAEIENSTYQYVMSDWVHQSFIHMLDQQVMEELFNVPVEKLRVNRRIEVPVRSGNDTNGDGDVRGLDGHGKRVYEVPVKVVATWGEDFAYVREFPPEIKNRPDLFQRKTRIMHELWRLNPALTRIVDILLSFMNGKNHFLAVHMRRGDKVGREMNLVETQKYVDAVGDLTTAKDENVEDVFVMSDDVNAVREFQALMAKNNSNLTVHSFTSLWSDFQKLRTTSPGIASNTSTSPWDTTDFSILSTNSSNGYDHGSFTKTYDKNGGDTFTLKLVLETTIAGSARDIVCTFSSNVCRAIALLRGDVERVVSLDDPKWNPF